MNLNLIKTQAQCRIEHAPSCQASCPLHLPVRTLVNLIRKENYDQAAGILQKHTYFPRLVAKACSAPCEQACLRKELDESVAINQLEKVVVAKASFPQVQFCKELSISKKIALIGGGLSTLAAAWYLYEKGFNLTVFEKTDSLGGQVRTAGGVSPEDIALDLAPLMALPIEFRLATEIGKDISWPQILEEYDGIYLSGDQTLLETITGERGIDPKTLQTRNPKVFAGGSILRKGEPYSLVNSIADGRKAAISLERFLKNKSLIAARQKEGSYRTKLEFQLPTDLPQRKRTKPTQGIYTSEEGLTEAERCLDCRCLSCSWECKLVRRFSQFSKAYIKEIAESAPVLAGGRDKGAEKNCNLCGLCKDVCPNALPFSKSSEAEGIQEKSGESGIAGGLAWSRKPIDFPVRDMLFSNSDEFSLCRHSPDREESAYLFFPGCQMAASMPEYIAPAYRYLQQKLDSVGIFLGCCGAPADWSGQSQLFEQTMAELLAKWEQMGKPTMIVGCTTCYQQFKAAELRMQVLLLWEIFAEYGLPQLSRQPHPVAVHDSCTIRYEKKVQDAVRQILQQAGYQIEELKNSRENTKCCGYSGLVFCEDKDLATKAVLDRVEESSLDYLVYCTVCRNYFISVGKPTYHILDVIFGQDSPEIASKPAPTLRQQEENRRKLKRTLLQEFYQDGGKNSRGEGPLLFIDPQLHRLLEERLIDEDKIQEVILSAEEQNRKLLNPKNNHYIASLQPGIITYWVEYAPKDGGYEVYNAYSHRIKIGEGD